MSEEEEGLALHNSTLDVASGDEDALMIDCEEDFDDDEDGYEPPADESVQEIVDADEIFRRLVASSPKELMD